MGCVSRGMSRLSGEWAVGREWDVNGEWAVNGERAVGGECHEWTVECG